MRRFGEHEARPAHRLGAEVLDVPVVAEPVDGRILAHRRDRDAVRRGDGAEGDRLKQQGRGHARSCVRRCGAVSVPRHGAPRLASSMTA